MATPLPHAANAETSVTVQPRSWCVFATHLTSIPVPNTTNPSSASIYIMSDAAQAKRPGDAAKEAEVSLLIPSQGEHG